jgi:hypothetical protein
VPPGQEGKITLAIEHTEGYAGEVAKSAAVKTNDPANSTFTLMLRAHFKPNIPAGQPLPPNAAIAIGKAAGPFNVSPNDRWITSVITGGNAKTTLYLMNREAAPVHIKSVVVEGTDFTAAVQPIEDGRRYELTLSTNPALKPGSYKQAARVITDSKTAPETTIQMEATVFPKVFATPSVINLPSVTSATLDSLTLPVIYVRKVRDGGLKIKSVSSSVAFIKASLSQEAEGQIYSIRLELDRSKVSVPSEFRGTVRVETNDPDVPVLEIPIQGSFVQKSY